MIKEKLKKLEHRIFGPLEGIAERVFVWGPTLVILGTLIIGVPKLTIKAYRESKPFIYQQKNKARLRRLVEGYDGSRWGRSDVDEKRLLEAEKRWRGSKEYRESIASLNSDLYSQARINFLIKNYENEIIMKKLKH